MPRMDLYQVDVVHPSGIHILAATNLNHQSGYVFLMCFARMGWLSETLSPNRDMDLLPDT